MVRALWIPVLLAAGCGSDEVVPDASPDDAAVVDAPTIDAAIDAPVTPLDAAPDLDAATDAAPVNATAALVLDPAFSTDGSEIFVGITRLGDVATAGARIGVCGRIWMWDQGQLFPQGFFAYRTRPGASETVIASQFAMPPANQYPRGCPATALFADGTAVFATEHGGLPPTFTQLVRRDAALALTAGAPAPSTREVRGMHALAGNGIVELFDDAAWVLDAALQPVVTVGTGGRIALPAPPRASLVRSLGGPRLDVVTATSMIRFDLATGARDLAFGNGGEVVFPGAAFTVRGVVPLAAGRTMVVGNATAVVIDAAGTAARVALPLDPLIAVEDRAGGAYLVTRRPGAQAATLVLTQIAESAPGTWSAGTVSMVTPVGLCVDAGGCLDRAVPTVARWTADDRLALGLTLTRSVPNDFNYTERATLLVLRRP